MKLGQVEVIQAEKRSRFYCYIKCQSFIQPILREDIENLKKILNMYLCERCCDGGFLNESHIHNTNPQ